MKKIMVNLDAVSRFRWDEILGANLKKRRGELSRRTVAEQVARIIKPPEIKTVSRLKENSFTSKYLERLERAEVSSVAAETLIAIADVLAIGVEDLLADRTVVIMCEDRHDF